MTRVNPKLIIHGGASSLEDKGGLDYLSKRQDAKTAMVQAALAQRQAQIDAAKKTQEEKSKTRRTAYIIGGSVLGVALIVTLVLVLKNKGKGK